MYDIIIVGAGHAGCEAAYSAATMGSKVLLITMDMTKIGQMSCNPAMGGIAKGQIVREIDALGGMSGIVTDASMIQFRMLNKSKGPAMWSPRAQNDRTLFTLKWREILENNKKIDFWQDSVTALIIESNTVKGVETNIGVQFFAKTVILTTGTFENGIIHIGRKKLKGGRISESRSEGISNQLKNHGFEVGRMKTGTPARIDGRTIDFERLVSQEGDPEGGRFSYLTTQNIVSKRNCYITHTNKKVHDTLRTGFDDSPLYNGTINGIGPRYCPSIEDKIVTFADKQSHQLFIEPEGLNTYEYYINGFSSSLPLDIQYKALRQIEGLENVKIFRPGYAIEYDFYAPTQLKQTLETRKIQNLYFAGQINGTTGYEEAAAQGLVAGVNAHQKVHGGNDFIMRRDESYIGVLIDDLITKGVDEPYRMFTSRAEFRTILRQDNADERLTHVGYKLGLASKKRMDLLKVKTNEVENLVSWINEYSVSPTEINTYLSKAGTTELKQKVKLVNILSRPQVCIKDLANEIPALKHYCERIKNNKDVILESAEIKVKYSGYIEREKLLADKMHRLENIKLKSDIDYNQIKSLSTEARQKLERFKPKTIGQASRISGINPSDINILLVVHGR